MAILALATSGPNGGLALQTSDGTRSNTALATGRGRGRDVMPAVQRLLTGAELEPCDIGAIVVDVGPGSFTGVRVGVTVAKTLAWSLGLDVHAFHSLEVLAACVRTNGRVVAVRDAGRGGVYHARWRDGVPDGAPGRTPGRDLGALTAGACVVGDDAAALTAKFGWSARPVDVAPGAEILLDLLGDMRHDGREACPAHELVPLYLQASAPERKAAGEVD